MLVEWRSALTKCGELCVTGGGMQQMQMSCAVNWDSCVLVRSLCKDLYVEWD